MRKTKQQYEKPEMVINYFLTKNHLMIGIGEGSGNAMEARDFAFHDDKSPMEDDDDAYPLYSPWED